MSVTILNPKDSLADLKRTLEQSQSTRIDHIRIIPETNLIIVSVLIYRTNVFDTPHNNDFVVCCIEAVNTIPSVAQYFRNWNDATLTRKATFEALPYRIQELLPKH